MTRIYFVIYALILFLFLIFSYAFIDPNLFYLHNLYSGTIFEHRLAISFLYGLFIFVLFIFYTYALTLSQKNRLKLKDVKILIGITIAILVFSYPAMLSFDIFNYIVSSKVLFLYHENPYIVMPIELGGEPLLRFTHAANKIALYGPFWIAASGIPYFFGFGNFLITLFSFKLFIAAFYISTTILIWKISKNVSSVVFFALNPLVVIETLVSSHNDIFMMFFALLSLYLLKEKKTVLGFFSLGLSILVKYATFFIFPVFVFTFWETLRKSKIYWDKIFYIASILMFIPLLLSPIREEIYPWYAIWSLVFVSFVEEKKWLVFLSIALSFGLLLRYIPFMLLGTYSGITPMFKIVLTVIPLIFVLLYFIRNKIWLKNT